MVLPLGDLQRTRIVPYVTYALIAINVARVLVQQQQGDDFTLAFAATPYEIVHNEDLDEPIVVPVRVRVHDRFGGTMWKSAGWLAHTPSAQFPCASPCSLRCSCTEAGCICSGNMLYLWIVGDNVEEVLGWFGYLVVYLACGLVGSLAQILVNPDSITPTLGASGAIAGIMGAYVIWFPHNQIRVLVFRFITVLPAIVVIGGWIALQIYLGAGAWRRAGDSGGVAYLAHVGGAVTGIFVAILFMDQARYVTARNSAMEGWSAYEQPLDRGT